MKQHDLNCQAYCKVPFNCLGLPKWRMNFQLKTVFCRSDCFALNEKSSTEKFRIIEVFSLKNRSKCISTVGYAAAWLAEVDLSCVKMPLPHIGPDLGMEGSAGTCHACTFGE